MCKQKYFGLLPVMLAALSLFSCKKDDAPFSAANPPIDERIQQRWAVSGAAFSSMEFNNSNQAIVVFGSNIQDADSIRSYFYKVLDSKNIDIKNFGKLEVGSISDTAMQFQFTPKNGLAQSLNGKKSVSSVGTSSNTSLFCRTWKMDRWTIDGEDMLDFDTIGTMTATFTTAGTYYIQGSVLLGDSLEVDELDYSISWWKWNPSAPGQKICYSHESENFGCDSNNVVSIQSLTASELVMDERGIRYYLLPYNLPGRMALQPNNRKKIRMPEHSFLFRKTR
jgi:hypothetical protein